MNTQVEIADGGKRQVEDIFAWEPVATDWDFVRAEIIKGNITTHTSLAEIKRFEPMRECDPREHTHWCFQQNLRLAIAHKAGRPLELKNTCIRCGKRPQDCLFGTRSYDEYCLHCTEFSRQTGHHGSRGNCNYLAVKYNVRSTSWGLLHYSNHFSYNDAVFMFWLADFFRSREEAERSLWPITRYTAYLDFKYDGMMSSYIQFDDLLPLEEIIKLKLPFTPEQFTAHLREKIQSVISDDHAIMSSCVRNALDEHYRRDRD